MSQPTAAPCPNCERLHRQVQALQELGARQQQAIEALSEQVRVLQEKLAAAGKDSSTSSKPPPPTSSSRPGPSLSPARAARSAASPGTPNTSAPPSPRWRATAAPSTT